MWIYHLLFYIINCQLSNSCMHEWLQCGDISHCVHVYTCSCCFGFFILFFIVFKGEGGWGLHGWVFVHTRVLNDLRLWKSHFLMCVHVYICIYIKYAPFLFVWSSVLFWSCAVVVLVDMVVVPRYVWFIHAVAHLVFDVNITRVYISACKHNLHQLWCDCCTLLMIAYTD